MILPVRTDTRTLSPSSVYFHSTSVGFLKDWYLQSLVELMVKVLSSFTFLHIFFFFKNLWSLNFAQRSVLQNLKINLCILRGQRPPHTSWMQHLENRFEEFSTIEQPSVPNLITKTHYNLEKKRSITNSPSTKPTPALPLDQCFHALETGCLVEAKTWPFGL